MIPQCGVSVSLSITQKPAERIEVLFGMETLGDPKIVLDGVPIPLRLGEGEWGKFCSFLKYSNIAARIRCGLRQITLACCLYFTAACNNMPLIS